MDKEESNFKKYGWYALGIAGIILIVLGLVLKPAGVDNSIVENNITKNITIGVIIPFQEQVCSNLDNGKSVYPAIMQMKSKIEKEMNMNIKMIYGNETSPRMWDNNGVMCDIGAELCHPQYLFCFHINMVVPVNYTTWTDWQNNITEPSLYTANPAPLNKTIIVNETKTYKELKAVMQLPTTKTDNKYWPCSEEFPYQEEVTCDCARNTKTPCLQYCFVCTNNKTFTGTYIIENNSIIKIQEAD